MEANQPSPEILDSIAARDARHARIAAAWSHSRHVLVISHPTVAGSYGPARKLAAELPPPTTFADRWASALIQWIVGGGPGMAAEDAFRRKVGLASRDRKPPRIIGSAPLRAPHHTVSVRGMAGDRKCPGECTLAHGGMLLLGELPRFSRAAITVIGEAMDCGRLDMWTAGGHSSWPAAFRVYATAEPCGCGWLDHPTRACICSNREIDTLRRRMAPIRERADVATVDLTRGAAS